MNKDELLKKTALATDRLLKSKGYIAFVDLFIEMGYLSKKDYEEWRMKRVKNLESVIAINLQSINAIMKEVCKNSKNGHLKESYTGYHKWGKGKSIQLQFSKTNDPRLEKVYSTHFLSHQLTSKKQENQNITSPVTA